MSVMSELSLVVWSGFSSDAPASGAESELQRTGPGEGVEMQ